METKINVAEILKDKPKGTKLYSSACGKCKLEEVDDKSFKISFYNSKFGFMNGGEGYLDKNGKLYDDGECVVFPSKEMRDWSKFDWKKGDVLVSEDNVHIIFEKFEDDTYTRFKGKHYLWKECDEEDYNKEETKMLTSVFEKANDAAAQTYINTIEEKLGGKLNRETLEVEKAQPEFKDGDIIKMTWDKYSAIVIFWEYINFGKGFDSHVFFNINTKIIEYNIHGHTLQDMILRLATEEEKQQLFDTLAKEGKAWDAEKKKIMYLKPKVELRPFDKVLVRDSKSDNWRANLFGYIDKDEYYHCVYANWVYCIPYAGNESLLGTTKDVEG